MCHHVVGCSLHYNQWQRIHLTAKPGLETTVRRAFRVLDRSPAPATPLEWTRFARARLAMQRLLQTARLEGGGELTAPRPALRACCAESRTCGCLEAGRLLADRRPGHIDPQMLRATRT